MRIGRLVCILAGASLISISQNPLSAQSGTVFPQSISAGGGHNVTIGGFGAVVSSADLSSKALPGEPYMGIRKTTRVQKLGDGTTVTVENTVKEARDSDGRTYRASRPEPEPGNAAQSSEFTLFNVYDPIERTNTSWTAGSKVATVFHIANPLPSKQVPPRTIHPDSEGESLGAKTINGVTALGMRISRTIPEGQEGNDRPLTVILEYWYSPELKIDVLRIDNDPRKGMSTTELTDIDRGEPDPALFLVPDGYTIKHEYPAQQN